jgi:hypothetical protein
MKAVRLTALAVAAALGLGLFAWATIAGARMGDVMGYIARKGDAAIEARDQAVTGRTFVAAKVVAPESAWVIVHLDKGGHKPGMRIGYVHVEKGVSTEVRVPLDTDMLTPDLLVAVHADRGEAGKLEFDMDAKEKGPDKPFFVDGHEVATAVTVR